MWNNFFCSAHEKEYVEIPQQRNDTKSVSRMNVDFFLLSLSKTALFYMWYDACVLRVQIVYWFDNMMCKDIQAHRTSFFRNESGSDGSWWLVMSKCFLLQLIIRLRNCRLLYQLSLEFNFNFDSERSPLLYFVLGVVIVSILLSSQCLILSLILSHHFEIGK